MKLLQTLKNKLAVADNKVTRWIANNPAEAAFILTLYGAACNQAGQALKQYLADKKAK